MNITNNRDTNKVPSWQSAKMRMIIQDRWKEVWQFVEARDKYTRNLHGYLESLPQNFDG